MARSIYWRKILNTLKEENGLNAIKEMVKAPNSQALSQSSSWLHEKVLREKDGLRKVKLENTPKIGLRKAL